MSQTEFDAKFPGQQPSGYPPEPTRENPAGVFPKTDPKRPSPQPSHRNTPDTFVGNPYLMHNALNKVDHAFGNVITILEQEDMAQDRASTGDELLKKFKSWRNELQGMRSGEKDVALPNKGSVLPPNSSQEGGLFAD